MWIGQEFADSAARHADRPFLHVPAAGAAAAVDLNYGQARDRVAELKAAYARRGYGSGHRLGLMLDNRAEFFLHLLALNGLGASVVPIDSGLRSVEAAHLIDHSEIRALLTLPEHAGRAEQALRVADRAPAVASHPADLPPADSPARAATPGAATEAALVYTSGTTGRPKGCMLSNAYFVAFGRWYRDLGGLCALREGQERLLTPLPVNHMNALACSFMAMLCSGGCLIQLDRFHPSTWWRTVRETRATIIHYLGVMPAILLRAEPEPDEDFGGRLRFGFGAGIDPRHHLAFERRFGFPLIEAWAMTETGCGACLVAHREPRHVGTRCIGRPTPDFEHRLVDEAGTDVAGGAPGELLVRAAGPDPRRFFFSGYLKDEAATEEAWAGGWFHTGDVVRRGEDGSLHFVDRRKNIIRRSGENIAAVEVEGVLANHPAVAACAVVPVPDEIRGEEVMALIEPAAEREPDQTTAGEIFAHAMAHLAYFKAPGYVAFVTELPTTASQKIRRGELKQLAAERLAGGASFDLRAGKRRARRSEAG